MQDCYRIKQSMIISRAGLFLLLFGAIASILFAAGMVLENPVANTVGLPVEVIGPDGTTETVSLHASDVSSVDSLYLRAHSIGYPYWQGYDIEKASIRVNNGSWTPLDDTIARCKVPESAYDCIDGPYHTIRFEVALDDIGGDLVGGENTIAFRFNYANAEDSPDNFGDPSSGFRILDLELRDAGDSDMIDGTTFTWDDPSTWKPPEGYRSENAAQEGGELWDKRNILTARWNQDKSLIASCSDCHADDGRDLSYFAYSNKAIVARSKFHGLSEAQGKKIAAYIRNYRLEDPDTGHSYEPPGRPWHPVYQPGPTSVASRDESDDRTVGTPIRQMAGDGSQYAAAGAGVKWALDKDEEMLSHVFPGGPSADDFDIDATRDGMHVPVPIQLPDWNEWLPAHHPLDMWGTGIKTWSDWRSGFWDAVEGDPGGQHESFADFEGCAETKGAAARDCLEDLWWANRLMGAEIDNFRDEESSFVRPGYEDVTIQDDGAYRHVNLEKWAMVRLWSTIERHDAADEMEALADHNGGTWSNADWYTWPGGRYPFDLAPHVTGKYAGNKSRAYDLWLDNTWYELAMRINSGRGHKLGNRPVDWQYQNAHLEDLQTLGIEHPLRRVFTFMKSLEACESFDGGVGHIEHNPRSWSTNRYLCGAQLGVSHDFFRTLDEYAPSLHRDAYEILLEEQVEAMMYRHSPDLGSNVDAGWDRLEDERGGWEPASTTIDTTADLDAGFWKDPGEEPSQFYHMLRFGVQHGARPTLIDSAAAWNEAMVPSGAWTRLRCKADGGPLECSPTIPVELARFSATRDEGAVVLRWETASETNNDRFEIERTQDGRSEWTVVGVVQGEGESRRARTYRYRDTNLTFAAETLRYRLKQLDLDGSASYLDSTTVQRSVRSVRLRPPVPNPVQATVEVGIATPSPRAVTLRLYDTLGRKVKTILQETVNGRKRLEVDVGGLPSGMYFLRLSVDQTHREQQFFIAR